MKSWASIGGFRETRARPKLHGPDGCRTSSGGHVQIMPSPPGDDLGPRSAWAPRAPADRALASDRVRCPAPWASSAAHGAGAFGCTIGRLPGSRRRRQRELGVASARAGIGLQGPLRQAVCRGARRMEPRTGRRFPRELGAQGVERSPRLHYLANAAMDAHRNRQWECREALRNRAPDGVIAICVDGGLQGPPSDGRRLAATGCVARGARGVEGRAPAAESSR